jgi:hypothetical protein
LGKAFASTGHDIFFGVPNPEDEKSKKLIDTIGPNNASVGSVADALTNFWRRQSTREEFHLYYLLV